MEIDERLEVGFWGYLTGFAFGLGMAIHDWVSLWKFGMFGGMVVGTLLCIIYQFTILEEVLKIQVWFGLICTICIVGLIGWSVNPLITVTVYLCSIVLGQVFIRSRLN